MARKNSVMEILPRDRKQEFKRQVAQMIEEQVSEALSERDEKLFQPFFQTKEIAREIKRRQTLAEQHKFSYAYAKWGCLSCGTKERPMRFLWMCERCYTRRAQQLLQVIREHEAPEVLAPGFVDTVRMARASLLAPAVMAVAEPKALPSNGPEYEGRFTQDQAAQAAGINPMTLRRWLSKGLFQPPKVKLSEQRWLWTQEDVARIKTARRKAGRRPKGTT